MEKKDKLPRGHAYIRMRNKGFSVDIDYPELDSPEAERMMKAVMDILKLGEADTQPAAPSQEQPDA